MEDHKTSRFVYSKQIHRIRETYKNLMAALLDDSFLGNPGKGKELIKHDKDSVLGARYNPKVMKMLEDYLVKQLSGRSVDILEKIA